MRPTIRSTGQFAAVRVRPSFHSWPNTAHRKLPVSSNVRRLQRMPHFHLRPSTQSDGKFIYELSALSMRHHVESIGRRWSADRMLFKCENDSVSPWSQIISISEDTVGFLNYEARQDEIWLDSLLLLPPHQRCGIGSSLLNMIVTKAQKANLPIRLGVFIANPAKQFWERHGFSVYKEEAFHYYMQRAV